MDPADLRAFARRDRTAVESLKREHSAPRFQEQGGLATLRAGHTLYEYARLLRPDIPRERDRADDLAHHIALKRLLDRASRRLLARSTALSNKSG